MSITAAALIGLDAVKAVKQGLSPETTKNIRGAVKHVANFAASGNLVDFTSVARVEPTMLFDTTLATVPFISDVIATVHSLYSGLYIMAINLDNEVQGVDVRTRLEKFNPDRSLINASRDFLTATMEDYKTGVTPAIVSSQYIGLPGIGDRPRDEIFNIIPSNEDKATTGADINKLVNDVSNLAVGKTFEIKFGSTKDAVTAVVNISVIPMPATPANIQDMVTVGTYDGSFKSRWRRIRAGQIKFWRDGIFAMDRIDAYAQSAIKDKSGYLKEMQRRSGKSAAAFALTGTPSPSTASAILMIHADTADKMYREAGIDLSNYKQRQALFERTYAMILCIVDDEWESAEFFYRNINPSTTVRAADMKRSSKGDGADVMELMKVYMSGSAPGRL